MNGRDQVKEFPLASLKVKHVNDKLAECRQLIESAVQEVDTRFPKSIFEQTDASDVSPDDFLEGDDQETEENGADADVIPVDENPQVDTDNISESFRDKNGDPNLLDVASSYLPSETSYPIQPLSPGRSSVRSLSTNHRRRRTMIKNEMLKLFKLATGGDTVPEERDEDDGASITGKRPTTPRLASHSGGVDTIPIVTAIPRVPQHSYLQLFRLQIPSVLGTVTRIVGNSEGMIAGCTVHGEIFLFSRLPYSRHPDAITRGHDGGIVSLTWLTSPGLGSLFVTTGTDRKVLLWEASVENGIDGPHCELRFSSVPTCCCVHRDVLIFGYLDNSISTYKVEKFADPPTGTAGGQLSAVYKLSLARGGAAASSTSFTKPITAVSVSPDGRRLAVGSTTGTIGLFDLSTMSLDVEVDCRNRSGSTSNGRKVVHLHWSQDSTCVVISSCDSRVRIVLVSDLSRRTKFKSVKNYVTENLFLGSIFGPPSDGRIIGVSETGHVCIWGLHSSSQTNENCKTADLITRSEKHTEISAAHIVSATDRFVEAVQSRVFDLGDGFKKNCGHFIICCDTNGSVGIFAELFTP